MITSLAFALGLFELIDLLHKIDNMLYFLFVKFSRTKLTSELLNINLVFVLVKLCIKLNKLLWFSIVNPFSVYPTNEVSVSGAYGGSRYIKSFGFTIVSDVLKSQHSNITFCIKLCISSRCSLFIIYGFL